MQADDYGCLRIALRPAPAVPELLRRGLARAVAAVGGFPPSPEGISSLLEDGSARQALAGVIVERAAPEQLLVYREAARIVERAVAPGDQLLWDHRFRISVTEAGMIGPIGEADWPQAVAFWPDLRQLPCPHPARLALPALRREGALRAVGGFQPAGAMCATAIDLKAFACGIMSAEGSLFYRDGNLSSIDGA